MKSSAQLEREAEQCRAEIADTLDELRGRMTPGHVVDRLVDYAREGDAGQFVRNLQRQVVDNPLPLTLIGAGLAWLMVGTARGRTGTAARARSGTASGTALADDVDEAAGRLRDAASGAAGTARDWAEKTRSAVDRARDQAASAYESGAEMASGAGERLRDSTASVRSGASRAGHNLMATLKDQPLILAGIGLALGAAIGAALPPTDTEDRLMGKASDEVKKEAQDFAGEEADKAGAVAAHALDEAKHEAARQGLASGGQDDAPDRDRPTAAGTEAGATLVPAGDEDSQAVRAAASFGLGQDDRERR